MPEFLFGQENALLASSVMPLVRSGQCPFRPLLLAGPSGAGKSHLAAGIASAIAERESTIQLSAADFARRVTESVRPVEAAERHRLLHRAKALILEDVQQLVKKTTAQMSLVTLLDTLVASEATVIVTSNTPPTKLSHFAPALIDRLCSGLVVSLALPSPAVRRAMIAHIAQRENVGISADAADRLAEAPLTTWNDLRGAVLNLRFANGRERTSIRLADVRDYLSQQDVVSEPDIREISIAVAKHFGLRLGDLQGPSRRRNVVDARNIAAFIARQITDLSLQQIGQSFGGRDHTTILHGIRKLEHEIARQPTQQLLVDDLIQSISS